MTDNVSLGFIGFGEAGFEIARGLQSRTPLEITVYDSVKSDLFEKRVREAGVKRLDSVAQVAENADMVLSVVPPSAAVAAARELAGHLKAGQYYLDLSSSFPDDMKTIASLVAPTGAHFVDGAMMGPLPLYGCRVLIYVAGGQAQAVQAQLNHLGMNVKAIGSEPGQASAVKLILSVVTKGLGSLLVEMLLAAHHFKVEDATVKALLQFYAMGLEAAIDRSVGSTAIHAGRRITEMESSLRLLKRIGVDPVMTGATVDRLKWFESLGLAEYFKGVAPKGYKEVVDAWEKIGIFKEGNEPVE